MKTILSILGILVGLVTLAQEDFNEQLAVPLSSPGSRGTLEIGLIRGDIKITAYSGNEVVINANSKGSDCDSCKDKDSKTPEGMKRISTGGVSLEATEKNNRVEISTSSWSRTIHFDIKVPKNFDLDVSTVHGKVTVEGVNGAMEVSATHGPLTFKDVAGSIICNTVHGKVQANFTKVNPDEPMSFVTLHGDVDVTFPTGIKAMAKMKSDRGEVFTDFDMEVAKAKPEFNSNSSTYKVSVNNWIYGEIGGGGPEYTFKNMHGNIYIRRKN